MRCIPLLYILQDMSYAQNGAFNGEGTGNRSRRGSNFAMEPGEGARRSKASPVFPLVPLVKMSGCNLEVWLILMLPELHHAACLQGATLEASPSACDSLL